MELREFMNSILSRPTVTGGRLNVQLLACEVGALVAVRRSVADVDWI